MHVVCAGNIVVLWCVGVSCLQGGGVVMFTCREKGCDSGDYCIGRHAQYSNSISVALMLYYDIVDFIASCCGLFIDMIISYCLRMDTELFQEIHKLSLLDKMYP